MPMVALVVMVGAYVLNNSFFDLGILILFGVIGYVLRLVGYEFTPMIIGLFLGPAVEKGLLQTMVLVDGNILHLFLRPFSAIMIGLALLFILFKFSRSTWKWFHRQDALSGVRI
jgi:putative tricarboxylic transport membrane protein